MKIASLFLPVSIAVTIGFVSCTPKDKDGDIKTEIETKLKAANDMQGVVVNVNNGIVTIEGQCREEASSAICEKIAQEVNGVKTVINNLSVPLPVALPVTTPNSVTTTAPVMISADDSLSKSVAAATGNYPAVKAEVKDRIITLTGKIKKNELPVLMKDLSSLTPKKITNKLILVKATKNIKQNHRKPKRRSRRR